MDKMMTFFNPVMPDCIVWSVQGTRSPHKNFWLVFCLRSSLKDQFPHRFSIQFAALPTQFSKKGLKLLLPSRMECFQCNPCSSALGLDGLMKQGQE